MLFSCRPAARCLCARALPCIKSEEKERLLAVYCSQEKAATTRQALKIPLSFLFDIFRFSTLRILTSAEFVCTGIKISKESAVAWKRSTLISPCKQPSLQFRLRLNKLSFWMFHHHAKSETIFEQHFMNIRIGYKVKPEF